MAGLLQGKRIVITGGTGSLGTALVRRLLSGASGQLESITVFSRDEAKQHDMRLAFPDKLLKFVLGDVRDYCAVLGVLLDADIVIHAAAQKHVFSCEDNPVEASLTNVMGTANIVRAVRELRHHIDTVLGVSSDKGVYPVNVYGASKFIQEKILLRGNIDCPVKRITGQAMVTRFICVRYGNVMGSRGSVIPIFQKQIKDGGPVTVTNPQMTRFLISLDQAVDTLLTALAEAQRGEVYIPIIPSVYIGDMVRVLIGGAQINIKFIGKQPGEKMHEVLITEDEAQWVALRGNYYIVTTQIQDAPPLTSEYNSKDYLISQPELSQLLAQVGLVEEVLLV